MLANDEVMLPDGGSMPRPGMDYLDMYLLHWRGSIPFAETVACMQEAVDDGLIRRRGVSNLNVDDMRELLRVTDGSHCCVD